MLTDLADIERDLETSVWLDDLRSYAYQSPGYESITGTPLRSNIAVDCQLEVWQAFATGGIGERVILEIGPGVGKSTVKTVAESWEIARDPSHRTLNGSHSYEMAARDSRRTRRIVESDWYRARFGVRLQDDENQVGMWATTRGGFYVAVGSGSGVTGHRVREVVVDDGLSVIGAHSKADRESAYTWLTEGLLTRLDSWHGREGRALVIGQRLAATDLQGRLREAGGWTIVTVPAEFDPRRRCFLFARDGRELWRDTRENEGDLVAPDVLGAERLAELRQSIGSVAFHAQYNQEVSSDEISICPARWWQWYRQPHAPSGMRRPVGCNDAPAVELPERFDRKTIAMDATHGATGKTADYAVIVCWGASGGGRYLLDFWRRRAGFEEQLAALEAMTQRHPGAKVVIESAALGRALAESIQKRIPGVVLVPAQGSKTSRIAAVVPQVESAACFLPESAAYVADLVDEFQTYPGRHDDIPDACAYGLADLAVNRAAQAAPCGGRIFIRGSDSAPAGTTVHEERRSAFDTHRSHLVGGFVPK